VTGVIDPSGVLWRIAEAPAPHPNDTSGNEPAD